MAYKPVTAPMIRSLADGLDKAAHQLMLAAVKMENAAVRDIDFHWVTAANLYGPKMRKFCQDVANNVDRQIEDKKAGRRTAEQVEKERVAKRKKNSGK